MKNMLKKALPCLIAASVAVFALAGCAQSSTPAPDQKPAAGTDETAFKSSVLFCGSTSLYPIISSLASSFTDKYTTWDKVDSSLPAEHVSIYVAPGGSGVGVSAVTEGTADFGMLARDIKDSEVKALGPNYQSFLVAHDALTVSVNAANPLTGVKQGLDTDTIRKIFSGQLTTWDQVDPSLPAEKINVYIRDLSGGAYEVFQKTVMGDAQVTPSATQAASMTELATNIANDPWGIGYAGFGAYNKANAKEKKLSALLVDDVECNEANILNGSYKIQRPIMFVTGSKINPAEQAFIDYVFSATGHAVTEKNGYIPAFEKPAA
ncbi:phosphate ABC transporter substrate-binding protein [Eggerthellaceae bacterium zg-997]|nr:phosphate ABC transporter substrate-binding protein [Eggerthellaceae bacterium zg-997]